MFENIPAAKADPILGLQSLYNSDPRPPEEKINLGIGIYCDPSGNTPIMAAVKVAEQKRTDLEQSKKYVGMQGLADYCDCAAAIALGKDTAEPIKDRLATIETPGGTGAFRIACEFIKDHHPQATIWNCTPSWPNHDEICRRVGVGVQHYSYYDKANNQVDFAAMLEDLSSAQPGDFVIVHNCCHNPTGADLSAEQWQQLAQLLREQELVPILDNAYQGFGNGMSADAEGLRSVIATCPEAIICISHSKNFGLYRERIGALLLLCARPEHKQRATDALCALARANYSMPPVHGAFIVRYIYEDPDLYQLWHSELKQITERINSLRSSLAQQLGDKRYDYIAQQSGMFSLLGLNSAQIEALREKHGIYIVNSSRANIAALNDTSIQRLVAGIKSVS